MPGRRAVARLLPVTALAYVLGMVLGFYAPEPLAETLLEVIRGLARRIITENPWELALRIFIHNSESLLKVALLSPLIVVPVIAAFLNGVILGVAVAYMLESSSWLFIFLALAPHGVVEIPALLYFCATSTSFGIDLWRSLLGKDRDAWRRGVVKLAKGLAISLALLALAAFIEALVTPAIIAVYRRSAV